MSDPREYRLDQTPLIQKAVEEGAPEHSPARTYAEMRQDPASVICEAVSEVNQTEPMAAAYRCVDALLPLADGKDWTSAPWWHGWALREAFLAGVEWQKKTK